MGNTIKTVRLIHNEKAGDEGHSSKELKTMIEGEGYSCRLSDPDEIDWEKERGSIDLIVVAGGDGTVRAMAKEVLNRRVLEEIIPIALIPEGTANNISKSLGLKGEPENLVKTWKDAERKSFDVGRICKLEEVHFFLESFGTGLFPYLMEEMEKFDKDSFATAEDSIRKALEVLKELTEKYQPKECQLIIDGVDHSGNYLLVEVMNIRSIGPNLVLAPDADPGDGEFQVVLLPAPDREKFREYVQKRLDGEEENFGFMSFTAKRVNICWHGPHVHADDELLQRHEDTEVEIELRQGLLEFLV